MLKLLKLQIINLIFLALARLRTEVYERQLYPDASGSTKSLYVWPETKICDTASIFLYQAEKAYMQV